jgi:hypothetical protein
VLRNELRARGLPGDEPPPAADFPFSHPPDPPKAKPISLADELRGMGLMGCETRK